MEESTEKKMPLEQRLALKRRIEQVLSEILSDQYDCNIKIKFKPEPEELEAAKDSEGRTDTP